MGWTEELRERAARQHGVVGRGQLRDVGASRSAVCRAVAAGRLERLTPRVFRMPGSPDTPKQRAMAAALDLPGAVSGTSAASMWAVPGFLLEPVQVLGTRSPNRGRDRPGWAHSSVRLRDADVVLLDGVPVTTPARTLRDLAGRVHPDRLSQICDRMLSRRLLRLDTLHAALGDLPPRGGAPGTAEMRALILARPEGYRPADSNLELRFEKVLADAGEASFERQLVVGDDEGVIGRVDFLDRRLRVIVEVQSHLFHTGVVDAARDAERIARLRRAGWIVVLVTDEQVWHRKAEVVARVRAARAAARRREVVPTVA